MKRVATAAVIAPLFVLFVLYSAQPVFVAVMEILAATAFLEYANMAGVKGIVLFRRLGLAATLLFPLAFPASSSVVFIVVVLVLAAVFLAGLADEENGPARAAFTLLGILYVGTAFSSPVLIRALPDGERLVLLVCFSTWGADIGAYYGGRLFGKTKLAPRISPNKTVEGLFVGIFFSFLAGDLFSRALYEEAGTLAVFAAGAAGGLAGPLGDLFESFLKRYFGVKDSGALLPGHGGLLDRADALMFSAPVFYVFLAFRDGLF